MSGKRSHCPYLRRMASHGGGAVPYLAEHGEWFLAQKLGRTET